MDIFYSKERVSNKERWWVDRKQQGKGGRGGKEVTKLRERETVSQEVKTGSLSVFILDLTRRISGQRTEWERSRFYDPCTRIPLSCDLRRFLSGYAMMELDF